MKYKELFLRLRRSPFIRALSPGQEIRFLNQADKNTGCPPFLHHHEDRNGKGVELEPNFNLILKKKFDNQR